MTDDLTCKEAGQRGGKATLAKHGPDYFRELGRRGNASPNRVPGQRAQAARAGGAARLAKYGQSYFVEMGRRGGEKRALVFGRTPTPGRRTRVGGST
jgi:general stress protein YciG